MATIGQQLLDVPFPDMIRSMGMAIAQAQFELDNASLRLARMMAGEDYDVPDPEHPGQTKKESAVVTFNKEKLSLLQLGFTPTFYQFVDTIIEVKVSISMSLQTESSFGTTTVSGQQEGGHCFFYGKATASVSTVSASFAAKYQYSAEGSSLLRTKLVPVPPPAILEERIRLMIEAQKPQ
jgi:hypothetical protein